MSYDILGLTGNFPCDKIKKYRNKKIAPYYQYGTILLNTCPKKKTSYRMYGQDFLNYSDYTLLGGVCQE